MSLSQPFELANCCSVSSADTTQSQSQREEFQPFNKLSLCKNKQKSELCNKFMNQGACPYGQLCKFAHGSHQLRQNNKMNNRYKTKMCQSFFNQSYCHYGERCNFKHSAQKVQNQKHLKWKLMYKNNRDCMIESKPYSRLLRFFNE